jgi:SAM-dependent methyltransferase
MSSPHLNFEQIDDFLTKLRTATDDDQLRQFFSEYSATYDTDVPADPYGKDYRAKQFGLYELLAGKSYSPINEKSNFDVDHHAISPFPYCHGSSETVGNQLMAIGFLIKAMNLPKGAKILEFGPGWGNTTLALAKMGYRVTAVDIEKNFVDLIGKRAAMEDLSVTLVNGDFSYIESTDEQFDCVLFFECFHHAQDHLALMGAFDRVLNKNGIVCFGAEPILDDFPIPWGLRMDGESLWAIRKNGWLELGFNKKYFYSALARHGWIGLDYEGKDGPWSKAVIAKRHNERAQTYTFTSGALKHQVGVLQDNVLTISPDDCGYAIFGPYVKLPPGAWSASLILDEHALNVGQLFIDVVDKHGTIVIAPETECTPLGCQIDFDNAEQLENVEVRVRCPKNTRFNIRGIKLSPR